MEPYTLTGRGFVLDPPGPRDIDRIRDCCQDLNIQRWTAVPVPYGRADAERFVNIVVPHGWETDSERAWAIREITPHGMVLVGMVGLKLDGQGSSEVGYWLAADCRGRGLATAATRLATRHALDPGAMAQRRVVIKVIVGNWASRAVAVRCGFSIGGTIRSEVLHRGHPVDCWVGTMIPGDSAIQTESWNDIPLREEGP
jgi:RimJ/RimL family protein N-acetyltransferase